MDHVQALARISKLEAELRIEKSCRHGNKQAVVDTIEGIVEGQPTNVLNYLQRLRELVANEQQLAEARELIYALLLTHTGPAKYPRDKAREWLTAIGEGE
jgi:hypothetical protein